MVTIVQTIPLAASAAKVWDVVRDVGALHTRLAPGIVVDTKMEEGARIVTFANGVIAREEIVTNDDARMRLVWTIRGGRFAHHNGAVDIIAEGPGKSRFVWTADLLPDSLAPEIAAMMERIAAVMKTTLEKTG